ncbi:hypothetical protein A6R68_01723, partial [Neotoma lepida]
SELFTGLYSDYWGRDSAIFRSLGKLGHIRTEHDDERLLKEPKFVGSYMIPDNEDRDDNKMYFFFTEKALEAENKRPGRTENTEDVFLLPTRDPKNPVIFGLFNTTSKVNGGKYGTTKDYPDDAIRFARTHPLMYQAIKPAHKKPILVKTDGKYNLKQLAVDRVEAEDGQYDVLFIGTDTGIVLKVITIYNQETEWMEEVILEELQIFKQQLYIGSPSAVAQVRFHHCDMYGSACADCCLARDPYCAWDGISCSRYYPTGAHAKRRFRRQDVRHGNAAQQCFGQQFVGDALDRTEERLAYGIESNSTLLECTPRSLQAKVIWFVQKGREMRKE